MNRRDDFVPVWAVETMPAWGRVAAWIVWHAPLTWSRNIGLVTTVFAVWRGWWPCYVLAVVAWFVYVLSVYGRRHPSPFGSAILVDRAKVQMAEEES